MLQPAKATMPATPAAPAATVSVGNDAFFRHDDDRAGELSFRVTLALDADGGLLRDALDRALAVVVHTAATHAPALRRRFEHTAAPSLLDTVGARHADDA